MFITLTSSDDSFLLNINNIVEVHPNSNGGCSIYMNISSDGEQLSIHCDQTLDELSAILITQK